MHLLGVVRFVHDVSRPAAELLIDSLTDAARRELYLAAKYRCVEIDALDVPDSEDALLYNFCAFVTGTIEAARVVA